MPYPYYPNYVNAYTPPAAPAPAPAPAPSSGLIWVQGENGAKSYMIPSNSTVLLMDSESQRFYIKSVDASGMPQPLRTFEYAETTGKADPVKTPEYVTKAEFEAAIAELKKGRNDE